MSSPPATYHRARWRPDRLRIACRARGYGSGVNSMAYDLRQAINEHRSAANTNAKRLDWKAAPRWLGEESDPSAGRTGHVCSLYEIADTLGVSLDWLMGRVDDEPGLPESWRVLARAQGGGL